MEELIVFRVAQQLTERDYTAFSRKLKVVKTLKITYIILSVVLLFSAALLFSSGSAVQSIPIIIFVIMMLALSFSYPKLMGVNLFKNYTKLHNASPIPSEVVFCENHIFDNSNNSSTTFEYSQLERIVETDEHFFLMITKSAGLILRKDGFTQGDINQFRGFIASKSHIY